LRRHVEIGHVGVPHRFAVTEAADWLAIHLDVGDDINLRQPLDEPASSLLDGRPVKIAQAAAERDEALIAEPLIADQHHRMVMPSLYHAPERRFVEVP